MPYKVSYHPAKIGGSVDFAKLTDRGKSAAGLHSNGEGLYRSDKQHADLDIPGSHQGPGHNGGQSLPR